MHKWRINLHFNLLNLNIMGSKLYLEALELEKKCHFLTKVFAVFLLATIGLSILWLVADLSIAFPAITGVITLLTALYMGSEVADLKVLCELLEEELDSGIVYQTEEQEVESYRLITYVRRTYGADRRKYSKANKTI